MPFKLKHEQTMAAVALKSALVAQTFSLVDLLSQATMAERYSTANECLDDARNDAAALRDQLNAFLAATEPQAHSEAAE